MPLVLKEMFGSYSMRIGRRRGPIFAVTLGERNSDLSIEVSIGIFLVKGYLVGQMAVEGF